MSSTPAPSDPAEELAELQDRLYDLVVTSVTQTHRLDALRRLRRDAQEAAALADDLADAALRSASGMSETVRHEACGDVTVSSADDGLHELAVANPSFFVEKLGAECSDLQGVRELTVNGLQAIGALGDQPRGRVIWDLDWQRVEASGGRVRKLSVIDDG